jgi:integrase
MASLRPVGAGRWKATVSLGRVGGRERQKSWTFTAASKSAANRKAAAWEAKLHEDGRALYANPEKDRTIRAVAEAWLASIEGSPKYRTETARILKADVLPALGDTPVGRLTVAQVERYWRQMVAEGKNPSTLRAASVALTQVFELAIQYGWTMTNPVRAARRPKYRPRRISPPDVDTFRRIVEAAGPVWARLFYVAGATGMRRGEVAAIRASRMRDGWLRIDSAVSDVRGDDGAPIVKGPKTESGERDIRLTEETQLQLMGQLEFIRDRARRVRVPLVDDPFLWSFSPTCAVRQPGRSTGRRWDA